MGPKYRILYSETSRRQTRTLRPHLKPLVKTRIEQISEDPYIGKRLERELSGYYSLRAKRYRVIYRVREENQTIEIHYVGHRKDIYELFSDLIERTST